MRALLVGPGKMGRAIAGVLVSRGHQVVREIDIGDAPTAADGTASDVAFEFTVPEAAAVNVAALLSLGIPTLSGTTGWDPEPARRLSAERGVPFLHAPNFSLGVAAARRASVLVARLLSPFPAYEPGLLERHHSAKKDAPSGTAKLLAADVSAAAGTTAIPVVSLRQGGNPGEHTVFFEGPDETVEVVHRARSRTLFASGAVAAAEWLVTEGPRGSVSFDMFLDALLEKASRRSPK